MGKKSIQLDTDVSDHGPTDEEEFGNKVEDVCKLIVEHDTKTERMFKTIVTHNKKDKRSHLRTQRQLEYTSRVVRKMAENQKEVQEKDQEFKQMIQTWMMKEITANRMNFFKANWKLLTAITLIVGTLFSAGVLIAIFGG